MKPLPAQSPTIHPAGGGEMPSLPTAIAVSPGPYSSSNRRATTCNVQRVYPWLLFTSTAIAGVFCLMYITKPVIITPAAAPAAAQNDSANGPLPSPATHPQKQVANSSMMPSGDRLPGEKLSGSAVTRPVPADPRQAMPQPPSATAFEETNLRIQHILTAEAPGGHVARIDIDVPVLYQSRSMRWTSAEVAEARSLLARLADYQEKSRLLRAEGIGLLDSWNQLVEHSIPTGDLRADSPTLPINQQDAADAPRPAGLNTNESIQIQPSGK